MLLCLTSDLPIKVISNEKICPGSDTCRGSSRAMRRKQYECLQSKMRGHSFDSVESAGLSRYCDSGEAWRK